MHKVLGCVLRKTTQRGDPTYAPANIAPTTFAAEGDNCSATNAPAKFTPVISAPAIIAPTINAPAIIALYDKCSSAIIVPTTNAPYEATIAPTTITPQIGITLAAIAPVTIAPAINAP